MDGPDIDEVQSIVDAAVKNNVPRNLTGFLACRHDLFLQVIEGDRAQISALYARLLHDPRHRDLTLIGCRDVDERAFADWSMGLVWIKADTTPAIRRFCADGELDPSSMSMESVVGLMSEIAGIVASDVGSRVEASNLRAA